MRHQGSLAAVAQLVERVLGKDEVMGSNPISSFKEDKLKINKQHKKGPLRLVARQSRSRRLNSPLH